MNYIGKETTIKVGDKEYKLSRLSRSIMREFVEWAKTLLPDPLEAALDAVKQLSGHLELQQLLVKEALNERKSYLDFRSPEIQELLDTFDGQVKMVQLLLKKNHPNLNEDDCFDIALAFAEENEESFREGGNSALSGPAADFSVLQESSMD